MKIFFVVCFGYTVYVLSKTLSQLSLVSQNRKPNVHIVFFFSIGTDTNAKWFTGYDRSVFEGNHGSAFLIENRVHRMSWKHGGLMSPLKCVLGYSHSPDTRGCRNWNNTKSN